MSLVHPGRGNATVLQIRPADPTTRHVASDYRQHTCGVAPWATQGIPFRRLIAVCFPVYAPVHLPRDIVREGAPDALGLAEGHDMHSSRRRRLVRLLLFLSSPACPICRLRRPLRLVRWQTTWAGCRHIGGCIPLPRGLADA